MKTKNILAVACVVIVAVSGLSAQSGSSAANAGLRERFERELRAKNEDVATIRCLFSQTRDISVLAHSVKKVGKFYFKLPDCMLLAFDDGDYIKMTESWFEIKNAGKVDLLKVAANPMLKNMRAILSACVIGDFDRIDKGFEIDLTATESEWVVSMRPKRGAASVKISQIEVRFDRSDMSINRLKTVEQSGDCTQYDFWRKQFDVDIDNQLFDIEN